MRTTSRAWILAAVTLGAPAWAGTVGLRTEDGARLVAEHGGQGPKGVVLVHDAGRTRADWSSFATRLADNGFSVVSLDLRGHGDSKAAADPLTDAAFVAMTGDVAAGVGWLRAHGSERVTVVGAGYGATVALSAAAASEGIDAVVLLSPEISAHGLSLVGPIEAFEGPLLVVADAGNPAEARTAELLAQKAAGEATVEQVEAGTSGHRMLNTVPTLEALLVGWINGARGEGAELAAPKREVAGGQLQTLETTGEEYGAKP